ncbi:urease accessory protein UreF [Odoribacter lunatus]|uniref:urease accessory protein UreF n=1 Tax=Odoribacter lunatus TaxID=2941335 RepID=UPI00203C5CE2|nr:urease accessory UreF family protein [Odoribacter lunatus]
MTDDITRLMRLAEFADSAFPVGTFSFSNGLESAAFENIVHDAETLEQYTRTVLRQTLHCDAIAALVAFRAAARNDYEEIKEADRQVILCKMNAEARQMLTRTGKKMAEICTRITESALMKRWLQDIREQQVAGTYPVTQAVYFQQCGLTEKELFAAVEYGAVNMVLNAALRCVKVSHYETQAILYRLGAEASEEYENIRDAGYEDMTAFVPEMDILASLHEKGTMRMFMN